MERPIFKPVGTPVAQLDTPALVVDLTLVEQNIATLHGFFRQHSAKLRPHVSVHRCPALAHTQLAAGGTVGGISVSTVGEAEVFAEHGFGDMVVTSAVVTPPKMRRLCALAHRVTITVPVDHAANVQALSAAAQAQGVTLRVVVEVHTRLAGCGVAPGQPALELARAVHAAPHLEFMGLMTYEGTVLDAAESQRCLQAVLETRALIEQAGLPVRLVSVGNTSNYDIVGTAPGVTEVAAGSYVLLDAHYAPARRQFTPAARILTTVSSRPQSDTAITDAGQKAVSVDRGLPTVDIPGATVTGLSAEHCRMQLTGPAITTVRLGDTHWLTPYDLSTCTNLYDYIHAVRDGRLEAVWRVAARGQYR